MGIQNNLKIRDGFLVSGLRSSPGNFYGWEIRHAIFWGLRFGPGIFGGFVSSPMPPFDHLCYLKSGVPPGPSEWNGGIPALVSQRSFRVETRCNKRSRRQ